MGWPTNKFGYKPSEKETYVAGGANFEAGINNIDTRLGRVVCVGDPLVGATLASAINYANSLATACTLVVPRGLTETFSTRTVVNDDIHVRFEKGSYITSDLLEKTITRLETYGSGSVQGKITTSTAHGLSTGDVVYFTGVTRTTVVDRYNYACYRIVTVTDSTNFVINKSLGTASFDASANYRAKFPALSIKGGISAGDYPLFTKTSNVEIKKNSEINALWFGADSTKSVSSSTALNNAILSSCLTWPRNTTYVPPGEYLIDTQVSVRNNFFGAGSRNTYFYVTATGGTSTHAFHVKNGCSEEYENYHNFPLSFGDFQVRYGSATYPARQQCTAIYLNQPSHIVKHIIADGFLMGINVYWAWRGVGHLETRRCDTGINFYNANTSDYHIDVREMYQYGITLNDCGGISLRGVVEGYSASTVVGCLIDSCSSPRLDINFETAAGSLTNICHLKVGNTTECRNLRWKGVANYATGGSPGCLENGYIRITKVTGLDLSSARIQCPIYLDGQYTRNVTGLHQIDSNVFWRGDTLSATYSSPGKIENCFPNAFGRGGALRGFQKVVANNCTFACDTNRALKGGNYGVYATNGATGNYLDLRLPDGVITHLKTTATNKAFVSGFMFLGSAFTATNRTPGIFLRRYTTGATWYTSSCNFTYGGYSVYNWLFCCGELDISTTTSQLWVRLAANASNVAAGASDSAYFSGICVTKNPITDKWLANQFWSYHPSVGYEIGTNLVMPASSLCTDVNQNFLVGDRIYQTSVALDSEDYVCIGAGTGSTSVWVPSNLLSKCRSTIASTVNYTINTTSHVGARFTNASASTAVVFSLATCVSGLEYSFTKIANKTFRIDPKDTQAIQGGAAGKYLSLTSLGASVTLRCIGTATTWQKIESYGTMEVEA